MFTQPAFNIYKKALIYHFNTLGESWEKHKGSEEIYTSLFDILHNIAEGEVAMKDSSEYTEIYEDIETFKKLIESGIKNEQDEGMKNRLITAYDSLQILCKKAKSLNNKD